MRVWSRFCVFALALLVGLAPGIAARAEYHVSEAGLRFPDRLGTANLVKGTRFPQAAMGHGVEYRGPDFAGSIYIYDGGALGIPDGITSPLVRAQFDQARGDIFTIQKQRGLPEPQLIGESTIRVDNFEFLGATYRFTRSDVDTLSVVGLTGFRRHFIKLRVSVPASSGAAGITHMQEFVRDIGRILADAGAR